MSSLWEQIKVDGQFHAECRAADVKANRAAERAHAKLYAAEEKEIARHQAKMNEIGRKRCAIFKEVYGAVYDPLEEAA
jgi:hypothetical protein